MLKKVLVANRGEIACRVMRSARRLRLATVAVFSEADRRAAHVEDADEAIEIGPPPAADSYLRADRIIAAAESAGADCIHPGTGFLSENAAFAEACRKAGVVFIGPSPAAMRALGDKGAAKALAERLGIPVVPGYRGQSQKRATLAEAAARIGYPVMIKAAAGGGGRGMRAVDSERDFVGALDSAAREAASAFGDGRVLVEKLIEGPRHVEVQVFGDRHGHVVHLFERDCSLQRRHQKVIEEAPAPGIAPALRKVLTEAAIALAKASRYEGAGTVEFLVGGGSLRPDAPWYFIEANTRLQVEHPVTEEVTGLDLVEWQFRVAAGEPLPLRQEEIQLSGHAVEARLYAEDPAAGFLPSAGGIIDCRFEPAQGVRIETALRPGDEVTADYDPMIAKVIARGGDRAEALSRLSEALAESVVIGPRTNAAFLKALVDHPWVRDARLDTGFIGREIARLATSAVDRYAVRIGARQLLALAGCSTPDFGEGFSPWQGTDGFQLGGARRLAREIVVDGTPTPIEILWSGGEPDIRIASPDASPAASQADGPQVGERTHIREYDGKVYVLHDLKQTVISWPTYGGDAPSGEAAGAVRAPINGRITKLFVRDGERIEKGCRIGIVEAMKMEHVLHAARAGIVARVVVVEGQQVTSGALVVELAPEALMVEATPEEER